MRHVPSAAVLLQKLRILFPFVFLWTFFLLFGVLSLDFSHSTSLVIFNLPQISFSCEEAD